MLTHTRLQEVLMYDGSTGLLTWKIDRPQAAKGALAGWIGTKGYAKVSIDDRQYAAHRVAWFYAHGSWPTGHIDHINGCRTDNRIENLREVSNRVNHQNCRKAYKGNSAGLLGVSKHRNKWRARIATAAGQLWLGTHDTPELAHAAYLKAKRALHEGNTL